MTDMEMLREYAGFSGTPVEMRAVLLSSADRIQMLEEERDNAKYLLQQYFQLSREASDEIDARIEKLETALREIINKDSFSMDWAIRTARKALEGKDDAN
jgi:hypothetical protein